MLEDCDRNSGPLVYVWRDKKCVMDFSQIAVSIKTISPSGKTSFLVMEIIARDIHSGLMIAQPGCIEKLRFDGNSILEDLSFVFHRYENNRIRTEDLNSVLEDQWRHSDIHILAPVQRGKTSFLVMEI